MSDLNSYSKIDKYKSWGKLKKQMGDLLCDALKDKITYSYTNYYKRNNTSMYGRATINYEKKEIAAFSWDVFFSVQWIDERKTINNMTKQEIQKIGGMWETQNQVHEVLMRDKWMPDCTLCHEDFIHAVTVYLKSDIMTSLVSENYLLRVFAYMDKRIGKRTLVKIKDEVEGLPEWVKQFYCIRCESEGIAFPPDRITDKCVI